MRTHNNIAAKCLKYRAVTYLSAGRALFTCVSRQFVYTSISARVTRHAMMIMLLLLLPSLRHVCTVRLYNTLAVYVLMSCTR